MTRSSEQINSNSTARYMQNAVIVPSIFQLFGLFCHYVTTRKGASLSQFLLLLFDSGQSSRLGFIFIEFNLL